MSALGALSATLADRELSIVPMEEAHREALRAICAEDAAIWAIYAVSYDPGHFDGSFDALTGNPRRQPVTFLVDGEIAGMTAWIDADHQRRVVEIGNTYLAPKWRGTGMNRRTKKLLLDHGFACGYRRIELKVDSRNLRSQAACAKIGAVREGVIRADRITWNGHVRDTVLFSILADEWRAR